MKQTDREVERDRLTDRQRGREIDIINYIQRHKNKSKYFFRKRVTRAMILWFEVVHDHNDCLFKLETLGTCVMCDRRGGGPMAGTRFF